MDHAGERIAVQRIGSGDIAGQFEFVQSPQPDGN
jgi:hypothetical protein